MFNFEKLGQEKEKQAEQQQAQPVDLDELLAQVERTILALPLDEAWEAIRKLEDL